MAKKELQALVTEQKILNRIYVVRGEKVMLDRDLAELYGIETRVLKQAVKRNMDRFPKDFMFEMTATEFKKWKENTALRFFRRGVPFQKNAELLNYLHFFLYCNGFKWFTVFLNYYRTTAL